MPIFDLSDSLVDQMVARSNVIMSIVLNALLGILSVEVVLSEDFLEKLILDWHFFFSRKESHVPVSILDLESPSMVSNVAHGKSGIRVGVKNSSNHVFALTRKEFWEGIFSTHDFLI